MRLGIMLNEMYSPNVARILKAAGQDFALIDCEHGAFDYAEVSAMTACSRALGFEMIIRIPAIERTCILKYLEMGADGILVPMVKNSDDVKSAVKYAKYSPLGERGISTRRAHNDYTPSDLQEYKRTANEKSHVYVQIETAESVDNLEAIAACPGLSGLLIGPNDLSNALGTPGRYDSEEFEQAVRKTVETAKCYGIKSGVITGSLPLIKSCMSYGIDMLSWSSETSIICSAASQMKKNLQYGGGD